MQKLKNNLLSIILLLLFIIPAKAVELYGDAIQGAMLVGKASAGANVVFDGIKQKTGNDGIFVIGLHRDAPKKMNLKINNTVYKITVARRKYNQQRINGLPKKKVTPPKKVLKRIKKEVTAIKKARKIKSNLLHFANRWKHPTKGTISGMYGSRRILNGKPKFPHYGLDYANKKGTVVIAPQSGKITLVQYDNYYSGLTIFMEHGKGINTAYLHLSKVFVKRGQAITRGQKIGEIGSSGRSTGPHLDWRLNWYNKRLDPALLTGIGLGLKPMGKKIK